MIPTIPKTTNSLSIRPFAGALIMVLLVVLSAIGNAQNESSPAFPQERHRALIEELDFTPPDPKETETPEEDFSDSDWFDWKWEAWELDLSDRTTWFIFAVLLSVLGFIIYRILGDISLRKRTKGEGEEEEISIEDIEEERMVADGVSLSMLERAERAGQYDIAVRLLYIQLLKELQDGGLIKYRKDFSNRDYQNQLIDHDVLADFRAVTYEYERYWFGKYPIDRLSYRNTYQRFQALNERIRSLAAKADNYA